MKQSLGLLEVSGLALAICCADAMAKAAAVTLLGLEKTNGNGWTVIKIAGDVASVHAAVLTGAAIAREKDGLVAQKVIARPVDSLLPEEAESPEIVAPEPAEPAVFVTCNLCLDPACPRQKGEPRGLCLHDGQRGER